ncbi:MAG: hypothetical protein Q7T51_00955 [Candidatus Moranbacteria bacterium]|nr:hypothetical protein [Candidatus Moranbacteria bacterium]
MAKLEKYRKYTNILPIAAMLIVVAVVCKSIWLGETGAVQSGFDVMALFIVGCCCVGWFYCLGGSYK